MQGRVLKKVSGNKKVKKIYIPRLKGDLAATLYWSINFLVLGNAYSPGFLYN